MNRHERHWHRVINAKLAQAAAASSEPPPWYALWKQLGPASSERDWLAFYQAVRNARSLPDVAAFYLLSWQIDDVRDGVTEKYLNELEERLTSIQNKFGITDLESGARGEGPPEYVEAFHQWEEAWDVLYPAKLEEFGEQQMANLFRNDQKQYDEVHEAGRQFFFGAERSDPEDDQRWLNNLRDTVQACMQSSSPLAPLGLRYDQDDAFWEVTVYPTPVELLGGAHDGALVTPGFALDLELLRASFESVGALGWQALGLDEAEGPHLYVEGVYQGREVDLQILVYAPEDEVPGSKLDMRRQQG
jgi:hypothetical protein